MDHHKPQPVSSALQRFAKKTGRSLDDVAAKFSAIAQSGRQASGPVIHFHCAHHDQPFRIYFKKSRDLFVIDEIEKLPQAKAASSTGSESKPAPSSSESKDLSEFSFSGFKCPHCQANSFLCCGGCKRYVCDKTVTAIEGSEGKMFHCPCGCHGVLNGHLTSIALSKSERLLGSAEQSLLGHAERLKLK